MATENLFKNSIEGWSIKSFPSDSGNVGDITNYDVTLKDNFLHTIDPDSGTFYFSKNVSNMDSYYGGSLTYTISSVGEGSVYYAPQRVIIYGNDITLTYTGGNLPTRNTFTDYEVPIHTGENWYVMDGNFENSLTLKATEKDFAKIFAKDVTVLILGEFISGADEEGYLSRAFLTPPKTTSTNSSINYIGTLGNDEKTGTEQNDALSGLAGADTLNGNAGNDTLNGGLGFDKLTGGKGSDKFVYFDVKDAPVSHSKIEVITDFSHSDKDKIDLSKIDADVGKVQDQKFSAPISGKEFSGVFEKAGQLFFETSTRILYGNVNAEGTADFAIQLNGVTALTAADFVL